MTLEQLKQTVASKVEANKAAVETATETARLTAKLAMLDNQNLVLARAKASLREETSTKLNELEAMCIELVASMPVFNKKTNENRKWNPSKQYGLGNHISQLTGILSGIQYSAGQHKEHLLALTGLTDDIIETTMEAFGSLPYYSKNYGIVVEGTDTDLTTLLDCIAMLEDKLNVTIDKSKLTPAVLQNRHTVARVRAEQDMLNSAKLTALSTQTITI